MKKIGSVLVIAVIAGLALSYSGCGKSSDSSGDRRAKLVGNENIELKKIIKERDAEIEKLKDQLTKKEEEIAAVKEDAGDATLKMMQHLATTGQETEKLAEENRLLTEQIKKLEAKAAEK